MATVASDIAIIESALEDCVRQYATPYARMFTVFDEERGHFLVIEEGWLGAKHLYNPFVHIEIRREEMWVQQDYTNQGIANDLVKAGLHKERIVLGYRPPSKRQDVEYSVDSS